MSLCNSLQSDVCNEKVSQKQWILNKGAYEMDVDTNWDIKGAVAYKIANGSI